MITLQSATLADYDGAIIGLVVFGFAMALLAAIILKLPAKQNTRFALPLLNPGASLLFRTHRARKTFMTSSKQIVSLARRLYPDRPHRILTDNDEIVLLPSVFADEIRNDPRLSFSEAIKEDNHAHIPGFEVVGIIAHDDQILQRVVRRQLTRHLSAVIEPLSQETQYALSVALGEDTDWHQIHLKTAMLDIIARISSRIYLGKRLCRNEDWLTTTKSYTTAFFEASVRLRLYPRIIRPVAHWFLPECNKLRSSLALARKIMQPLIDERYDLRQNARSMQMPLPVFHDSLEWAEEEAETMGSAYDPVHFQLTLALLAIHTTFDLLQQCILDLARNPRFIPPLREEITHVLSQTGWKKTAFNEMHLLDSAIKESQRLKPGSLASMRRYVEKDMHLSNGLFLPKGSRINVDSSRMVDLTLHPNPEEYDAYRFLRMRSQPGREYMAQLIATSPDHLGFGHGKHSCPGRFFASNEIKVALCHIIMKYEWKLVDGTCTEPIVRGMVAKSSPLAEINIRRRQNMELDLDAIEMHDEHSIAKSKRCDIRGGCYEHVQAEQRHG